MSDIAPMHRTAHGFSLMELMITVAVIALLASIVYPSYRAQVLRSGRTEAKVALMSAAQTLEKCYTTASTYVGCADLKLGKTPNEKYELRQGAGKITANAFDLEATPLGGQMDDTDCASFSMTNAGQSASNKAGNDSSTKCWR